LFRRINRCTLDVMSFPLHAVKAVIATTISLWMSLLACFIGCTLPTLLNQAQSGSMANMEGCHHHSKAPAKSSDGKSDGPMSCCPLEITVASKPDTTTLFIAPANIVLASYFVLPQEFSYQPLELTPFVFHRGRDTILQTRLLRI